MNPEERYKITSNEYADLIVQGFDAVNNMLKDPASTIISIEGRFGVTYIPVEEMTPDSMLKFGRAAIPPIFGLLSDVSKEASDIYQLSEPGLDLTGQGVLIGFVDTGIDYTNPVFRNPDHTTRIVSIWDQTIDSENYPENLYYGTEYTRDQINEALNSSDPFALVPSTDTIGHGTMVAGVAAGSSLWESNFEGVASGSELVVVKLKQAKPYLMEFYKIPEWAIGYQENDIMLGVKYLREVARRLSRPLVICLGLGTSQGAHEGQCISCNYYDDISREVGYSVVVAAGNEGNRRHHFYDEISPYDEQGIVELNIAENETGFAMELWGYAPNIVEADIYSPDNTLVLHIPPITVAGESLAATYHDTTILVDNILSETRTGDQFIFFRFQNPQSGIWRFNISGYGDINVRYHIWLPIYNYILDDTFFFRSDNNTTLSMPANTENVIAVTAYNPLYNNLFYYSSMGFTKDNRFKPDIAAPGVDITAPFTGNTFIKATGTSVAAAYTAGVAALLLEWGIIKGNRSDMNNIIIQRMLITGANRFPEYVYPNQEWGYGILDIYNSFKIFL
ncbi:S8 family peptidase [Anaerocolumna sp. AGMB13025]|uniref:S8 family peptidase n=1 Tax=Anaerocolumna sp. AGMB13025 TaxID=3039116 RepID=UPI00241EE378|nr:S8 family peptidase [Anaerocolumna sp. AGMB13025]WFR58524.1 S8 family peptidase [Anaerocolumna sp. AGMB13025]